MSGEDLSSSSFSLPAVCMVMSVGISVNSKLWVIHTHSNVATSSSACLSTDIPWSLVHLSQDLFPQYYSLQIWTFISPGQGTAYIFYAWDLEKKPSKCVSIRTQIFFFPNKCMRLWVAPPLLNNPPQALKITCLPPPYSYSFLNFFIQCSRIHQKAIFDSKSTHCSPLE